MQTYKFFKVETDDHVAIVSINRPDKSNALNEVAWSELGDIFGSIAIDDIRAVILRGEGKHFCAGMDLMTLMGIPQKWTGDCEARKREQIKGFIEKIQVCISRIEACPVPVIAAVHGACIGGGLSITSACDFVYCSSDSVFSIKETDLGIVPDIGVLQRLPYNIPYARLADLAYTARNFNAEEAIAIGMVNKLAGSHEELMEIANAQASLIAEKSPLVIRGIKRMLQYRRDHGLNDSLDYVANWNAAFLLSEDLGEAMQAYMNKTKPKFR